MPGFRSEENGLFEIKLVRTRDGLIYVNFDATTMSMPFNNVESGLDMEAYRWLNGKLITVNVNWKTIGKSG
jgi:phenylpropionate dioxygenase-like ring-hydroxylating dioxygenase large terminal subunit